MKKLLFLIAFASTAWLLLTPYGCKHEPILTPGGNPGDTMVIIPPIPVDSGDYSGVPCSTDTVYFQNQILPLMVSQCAIAGCHNVQSHEEGVITTDYAHIMQNIKPFNPNQSKIYKSITTSDAGDRMPRPPAAAWTTEQKNLLKKWIEQGATNNACNESYGGCDLTNVTYTNFVKPLLANKCLGCHTSSATGGGVLLSSYDLVKASASSGKLYGSVAWNSGFSAMPQGGQQISPCFVDKIQAWINAGMPQ